VINEQKGIEFNSKSRWIFDFMAGECITNVVRDVSEVYGQKQEIVSLYQGHGIGL